MQKIELQNENCFTYLPKLERNSIDLIIINPPYEASRDTNFTSGKPKGKDTDRFRVSMDFGDWDNNFTGLDEIIKECYRILKKKWHTYLLLRPMENNHITKILS